MSFWHVISEAQSLRTEFLRTTGKPALSLCGVRQLSGNDAKSP